jgi:hypothetical protein
MKHLNHFMQHQITLDKTSQFASCNIENTNWRTAKQLAAPGRVAARTAVKLICLHP